MSDLKATLAAGSEDAEASVSASEDESTPQQEITAELLSSLVKQVEFYFSDANLPTDKKLLKQIRKDPDGYVPVKLFANFRKVRALSKEVGVITDALRGATLLQLSEDGKRVRRIVPVPEYDISDIQRRTIVVENLPGSPSPTIESVTDMFRMYGRVKLVRICSRESKGKLPSWLTSSCQNMTGQQHAYVEFEEEDGAIVASAALAQECDAPDGVVQVRRLLACIAEQRERRSNGNGSSYGGSRKGSRDVSPMGSRGGGSRRNSGGGLSNSSYSCGGGSWTSSGGAAPADTSYHPSYHHHTYGGAYEHSGGGGGGARRSSTGGGAMSPRGLPPPPPPPPPPRRSCDSAPPSEMAPSHGASAGVSSNNSNATNDLRARLNIYRPPAKRLSDGYNPPVAVPSVSLQRHLNGSFTSNASSSCCAGASSAASTPSAAPSSPALSSVVASPPIFSRGMSSGGGRPPTHPPLPPPPSTGHLKASQAEPANAPASPLAAPSSATAATAAIAAAANPLAEAIAQAQAERRSSEAGGARVVASEAVAAAAASIPSLSRPISSGPTAPKFCFDLAVNGGVGNAGSSLSRSNSGVESGVVASAMANMSISNGGIIKGGSGTAPMAPKTTTSCGGAVGSSAPPLPRGGTQAQMVANVEDFINNILARPAARPVVPAAPVAAAAAVAAATAATQQRKTAVPSSPPIPPAAKSGSASSSFTSAASSFTSQSSKQSQSQQQQPQPVDAAAAVAGILATTLRRPPAIPPVPAAAAVAPSKPAATAATTAAPSATVSTPLVFLAAMTAADEDTPTEELLAHAVTVTVHASSPIAAAAGQVPIKLACSSPSAAAAAAAANIFPVHLPPVKVIAPTSATTATKSSSSSQGGAATSNCCSAASSVTSSPRESSFQPNSANYLNGHNGRVQPGAKRLTRREYAQWAAATPGFRAEAASKYGAGAAGVSPTAGSNGGGYAMTRCSTGGATAPCSNNASPSTLASISDGGAAMVGAQQYVGGAAVAANMWHVARGPDGSRGFAGRSRALAA